MSTRGDDLSRNDSGQETQVEGRWGVTRKSDMFTRTRGIYSTVNDAYIPSA